MATRKRVDKSIDYADKNEHVNVLLYSEPGAGKSHFGGSDDNVLFISPDPNGPISAKRAGFKFREWPIRQWDDFDECADYFYDLSVVQGEPIPYNWFVIDTLTEVQEFGMQSILKKAIENNPSRDPHVPALQDYMKNQSMLRGLVKGFNELPVNVLYTAWSMQYTDSEGNETLLPLISGGAKKGHTFSKEICGLMTSFGFLQVRNVKDEDGNRKESRRIIWDLKRTQSDGVITAKDRTHVLKPYTDDLSLKQVRELIESYEPPSQEVASQARQLAEEPAAPARKTRTARTTTRARRASATK